MVTNTMSVRMDKKIAILLKISGIAIAFLINYYYLVVAKINNR